MSFIDFKARLLGLRIVDEGEDHIVIRCPRWVPNEAMREVAERTVKDARLLGRDPKITVGDRLIRIDDPGMAERRAAKGKR